ncbi:MAG TPA: toll/interleukin-1 receptor domain-containing protein [Longimicrobium sp.]|nr:toll/interleukin-1 receptor domain-containing protein [Longimicrobium sp.]
MPLPSELFLSHSSGDHDFVERLGSTLRSHGLPVWYSSTSIVGARQWHDEIGAALGRCDWFIVVLSPRSVESMWVQRELIYALRQNRFQKRIVPVLLEPCDFEQLSWVLPSLQIIDFTADAAEGYRNLLRVWGIGFRP